MHDGDRPGTLSVSKSLFIKSFGCQMNVYDSGRMADVLALAGYDPVSDAADADVVILNTCHIREKAAEKVYSDLGRLRQLKDRRRVAGRPLVLAVAGCVAQAEGEEMIRRAPQVDIVLGPQTYHRLPDMVARARAGERAIVVTDFPVEEKFDHLAAVSPARSASAFLTIQEGCDRFCTFCVVPYTRGAEFSRPVAAVLDEARRLVDGGVCELTLLGQNVNAYHGVYGEGEATLAHLLGRLTEIPGLARLRYTTSHPRDVTEELIAAHRDLPQLMPYLHLPVQSGSDRVLAAMNRRHRAADYLDIIERLRAARPDLALSSDFIVGFPGESEADFEATLALVREVSYAQAYSFKYSVRPGTPAAEIDGQVDEPVKAERLARLQALLDEQQRRFNDAAVGHTVDVLFERRGRNAGQLAGRSPWMQAVHADAPAETLGRLARVEITAGHANSLSGRLAAAGTEARG